MAKRYIIIGLGEVLWDLLPDGPRFGGAPANFACHAAGLGAEVHMVSRVGTDDLGEGAITSLEEHRVGVAYLQRDESKPTGTVDVELNEEGQPSYTITEDVAWDALEWSDNLAELARRTAAVCFGTLGQRSASARQAILRFVEAVPEDGLRIFDVNLRQSYHSPEILLAGLERANVLKLNEEELPVVAKSAGLTGSEEQLVDALRARFNLRLVALTRGSEGALLLSGSTRSELPALPTEVRDTIGAGDAFTATVALGLLRGESLDKIHERARRVASFVCSKSGATPRLPDELTW